MNIIVVDPWCSICQDPVGPDGKCVTCTPPPSPADLSMRHAEAALCAFCSVTGTAYDESLQPLLQALLFWANGQGIDFEDSLAAARDAVVAMLEDG